MKVSRLSILSILAIALSLVAVFAYADLNSELKDFQNIMIDVRGSRGGKGDVAAGFLTARDLIERGKFEGTIVFIIDDQSGEILSKLYGKSVQSGTVFDSGKVRFYKLDALPSTIRPADLYFSLANPSGTIRYSNDLAIVSSNLSQTAGKIPITKNTVVIVQTVLGNTENVNSVNPNGLLQFRGRNYAISPAGIGKNENGIYWDPVAAKLRGKSKSDTKNIIINALELLPANDEKRLLVEGVLKNKVLQNSHVGLVYGVTATSVKEQFERYLTGLGTEAEKKGKSYTLITPSGFSLNDLQNPSLREKIEVITSAGEIPVTAKPGKIYIIKTGALPHEIFVGLMAYSDIPPLVAGDGAMSAAINLGRPFVMTRVKWNEKNIANLKTLLISNAQSDAEIALYERVYGSQLDLSGALDLEKYSSRFGELSQKTTLLTDTMIDSATGIRRFSLPDVPIIQTLEQTKDGALRLSYLSYAAERGEVKALRILERHISQKPLEAYRAFKAGHLPRNERIMKSIETNLVLAASDSKSNITLAAVYALEEMNSPKRISALIKAAGHSDPSVALEAVYALADIKSQKVVPALLKAAGHTDPKIASAAIFAIGQIENPKMISVLIKAAGHSNPLIARAGVYSLREIKSPKTTSTFIKAAGHTDPMVAREAVEALGEIRSPEVVPALIRALGRDDGVVTKAAERGLRQIMGKDAANTAIASYTKSREVKGCVANEVTKILDATK